jgi:hypothetical protein
VQPRQRRVHDGASRVLRTFHTLGHNTLGLCFVARVRAQTERLQPPRPTSPDGPAHSQASGRWWSSWRRRLCVYVCVCACTYVCVYADVSVSVVACTYTFVCVRWGTHLVAALANQVGGTLTLLLVPIDADNTRAVGRKEHTARAANAAPCACHYRHLASQTRARPCPPPPLTVRVSTTPSMGVSQEAAAQREEKRGFAYQLVRRVPVTLPRSPPPPQAPAAPPTRSPAASMSLPLSSSRPCSSTMQRRD